MMTVLLQALFLLAMAICLSKDFFTYMLSLLIMIMALHIFLATYYNDDQIKSGDSKHSQSLSVPSSMTALASSTGVSTPGRSNATMLTRSFRGPRLNFDAWPGVEAQNRRQELLDGTLAWAAQYHSNEICHRTRNSKESEEERLIPEANSSVDMELGDRVSTCGTDVSEETVDLAPEVTSMGFGDMHNHFRSTDRDRAVATQETTVGKLNEADVQAHTTASKERMDVGGGFYLMDVLLHAPIAPNQSVPEDDCDGEIVDIDWDLPPAKIDPSTGSIIGGLEASSKQVVDIGNVKNKTILLRIKDPVAVYVFPYYHKIEFRGEKVYKPRVVEVPTTSELNRLYTHKFELGRFMSGMTICSTAPLPKIYLDYHVYTEQFPQGFPATGAHAAWCMDQMSPVYLSDAVSRFAPYAALPKLRPFSGSTFTIQPMNTLSAPEFLGFGASNDPRVGENARYKDKANWSMKIRAGNRLMKIGPMEQTLLPCEVWPWSSDEISYVNEPLQILMPYEGFFIEQEGRQANQWRTTTVDGVPISAREHFKYHRNAQAWKAAQERAAADSPSSCLDVTEMFMELLPPDQFIPAYDEAAFWRNYQEHAASHWQTCNDLREHYNQMEWCMCDEWSEQSEDVEKATTMIHDSVEEYDEVYWRTNQTMQPWLEHIQCWLSFSEETGKFSWTGNDGFLLNTKGKNEQNHPNLLRKSGVSAEQKIPPTRSVFLADFQFASGGPAHKIRAAPVSVVPQGNYPWLPPGGNYWPV